MKNAIQHYSQMLYEKGKGIHSFWEIGYQEYAAKADPELVRRFEAGELIIKNIVCRLRPCIQYYDFIKES